MFKKMLVILLMTVVISLNAGGCKKADSKSKTDYEAEAKEQINKENMDAELDKIEKALEEESRKPL